MEHKPGTFRTSIGGQALIEGILMRGPEKQAIVTRFTKGSRICGSARAMAKNSTVRIKNATDARNTSLESPARQALLSSAYRRKIRSFMR